MEKQRFTIRRVVDAVVVYTGEVEAETAEQAAKFACDNEDAVKWGEGETIGYDARKFVAVGEDGMDIEGTEQGDCCI